MAENKTYQSTTLTNLHRLTHLLSQQLGHQSGNFPATQRYPFGSIPSNGDSTYPLNHVLYSDDDNMMVQSSDETFTVKTHSSTSSLSLSSSSSSDEYFVLKSEKYQENVKGNELNSKMDADKSHDPRKPFLCRNGAIQLDDKLITHLSSSHDSNSTQTNIASYTMDLPNTYLSYSPNIYGNDNENNIPAGNEEKDNFDNVSENNNVLIEDNPTRVEYYNHSHPLIPKANDTEILTIPPNIDPAPESPAEDFLRKGMGIKFPGSQACSASSPLKEITSVRTLFTRSDECFPLIPESPTATSPFPSSSNSPLFESTTPQHKRMLHSGLNNTALYDGCMVQNQREASQRKRIDTIPEDQYSDQIITSNKNDLLKIPDKNTDDINSTMDSKQLIHTSTMNESEETLMQGFRRRASSVLEGVRHKMNPNPNHRPKRRLSSPPAATFFLESFDGDFCRLKPVPGETSASASEEEKSNEGSEINSHVKRINKISHLRESLFLILSSLYGILVVLVGAVIPITEIFISDEVDRTFEAFYVYLYSVSLLFLVYVYAYLLRRNRFQNEFMLISTAWVRQLTRVWSRSDSCDNSSQENSRPRATKKTISLDLSNHHTGTFYLRLGVLGFGIGSMIHCGLLFGSYFSLSGECSQTIQVIKPLLHMMFVFFQLYFIFMNSKMCIHRYKKLARFGLMHMCATNVCVWFRSIVVETIHVIASHEERTLSLNHGIKKVHPHNGDNDTSTISKVIEDHGDEGHHDTYNSSTCRWSKMMKKAVDRAGPYLYPCTIEYSLMCACILYIMWKNVGQGPKGRLESVDDGEGENDDEKSRIHRMSVDCTSSSRGLFLGLLIMVGTIISIIAFYMLVREPGLKHTAFVLTHVSETAVYLLTLVALIMASVKMKSLTFKHQQETELEDILILISYTGLMAFIAFSLMASILHEASTRSALNIVTNVTMLIQATLQTIFMLAGDRMSAANHEQVRKKPGREFVTFMLISNFAMWAINTFETQTPDHNPIQVDVYGIEAWAIFTHISVPLGIYYRFHSTVCMSNIWKNAWKIKKQP